MSSPGANLLKAVLYQRLADGEWHPVYGPLSSFAGGAVMYAVLVLVPAKLVWEAVGRVRRGKREFWPAVWWALAGWLLLALASMTHFYAFLSPEYILALALLSLPTLVWVVVGVWRIVPLYVREKRRPPPAST